MNFGIFKNKKIIIVILILLIAGGYFLWQAQKTEDIESIMSGASTIFGYEVEESQGKQIIENKEAGLRFEVPDGWEITKISETMAIVSTKEGFLQENSEEKSICSVAVTAGITDKKVSIEQVKESIKKDINQIYFPIKEDYKIVNIFGCSAIRTSFETEAFNHFVLVDMLVEHKIFDFSGIFGNPGDENLEKCVKGLDDILSTVSIE